MEGRALIQYLIDTSDMFLAKKQEATEYLAKLEKAAKRAGVSKTPCYACGGNGVVYADGVAVNCVCNPVPNEDQSDKM